MKIIAVTAVVVTALTLTGCEDKPSTTAAPPAADAPRIASSYLPPVAEPPKAAPPTHNYAMEDGGQYGYQPEISDDERNRGVATKALVMIRYRGEKSGLYVVEMPEDTGAVFRMECKSPCQFVKTKVMFRGEVLKSATVPNTAGSLMYAVFEDALSGQLKPYQKRGG